MSETKDEICEYMTGTQVCKYMYVHMCVCACVCVVCVCVVCVCACVGIQHARMYISAQVYVLSLCLARARIMQYIPWVQASCLCLRCVD